MMDGPVPGDIGSTIPVSITVLSVTPMRLGKLFAIASVEIDIDGVLIADSDDAGRAVAS
jgi:hypothetical protein